MKTLVSEFKKPAYSPQKWAEIERENAQIERENERKRIEKRINSASIPQRFCAAKTTDARLVSWINSPSDGIIFQGRPGTGKSYAACAVLRACIERYGWSGKFITARAIIDGCFSQDAFTLPLKATGLLVIDDFGRQGRNEYAAAWLFDLIAARYDSMRPTIITTNYTGLQLMDRLSAYGADDETAEATMSRFRTFLIVKYDGGDRRGRA